MNSILPPELHGALMRLIGFPGVGKSYLGASMENPVLIDYVDFESKAKAIAKQLEQRGTPLGNYTAINEKAAGKGALAVYDLFKAHIDNMEQDRFTTMVLDNLAVLQDGCVAEVERNAKEYERNSSLNAKLIRAHNRGQQYAGASIAFSNLFAAIHDKGVRLIVGINHVGNKWLKVPVPGKYSVPGVSVLDKLSTLTLILMPPRQDTEHWPPPAALVSKEALGTFSFPTDPTSEQFEAMRKGEIPSHTMSPRFPRRFWPCTSQTIRRYLAHPADYDNLDEHETPNNEELAMFSDKLSKEQMAFVTEAVALEAAEKQQVLNGTSARMINPQSLIASAQAKAQPSAVVQSKLDAAIARGFELAKTMSDDEVRQKLLDEGYAVPIVAQAMRKVAPF